MKLLVVDLDGTLFRGNTLNLWVRTAFSRLVRTGRVVSAAGVGLWVILRKLRIVSHRRMKFHLMRLTSPVGTPAVVDGFSATVASGFNREVMALVETHLSKGDKVVLATAAPDLYAGAVARRAGISLWVATPMSQRPDEYTECRGEAKLRAVLSVTGPWSAYDEVSVVTDHADDTPLLHANTSGRNILIH